jgi:hypothetical protein
MSQIMWKPTLTFLSSLLLWSGCASGDDKRCSNTSECASDESCEAGICRPACTPGVDCPEKDVSTDDGSDSDADVTGDGDGDISNADGSSDADDGADGVDDSADGGPDLPLEDELACEGDRALLTSTEGDAFEVRFGERSTGRVALPDGWKVEPVCCAAGCCQ